MTAVARVAIMRTYAATTSAGAWCIRSGIRIIIPRAVQVAAHIHRTAHAAGAIPARCTIIMAVETRLQLPRDPMPTAPLGAARRPDTAATRARVAAPMGWLRVHTTATRPARPIRQRAQHTGAPRHPSLAPKNCHSAKPSVYVTPRKLAPPPHTRNWYRSEPCTAVSAILVANPHRRPACTVGPWFYSGRAIRCSFPVAGRFFGGYVAALPAQQGAVKQ